MVDDPFRRFVVPILAAGDMETPPHRAVVVVFNPADPPETHALYSNAAAADLVPVLKAVVALLESGVVRMATDGDVRFVEVVADEHWPRGQHDT